jgi:hypothetical protein
MVILLVHGFKLKNVKRELLLLATSISTALEKKFETLSILKAGQARKWNVGKALLIIFRQKRFNLIYLSIKK